MSITLPTGRTSSLDTVYRMHWGSHTKYSSVARRKINVGCLTRCRWQWEMYFCAVNMLIAVRHHDVAEWRVSSCTPTLIAPLSMYPHYLMSLSPHHHRPTDVCTTPIIWCRCPPTLIASLMSMYPHYLMSMSPHPYRPRFVSQPTSLTSGRCLATRSNGSRSWVRARLAWSTRVRPRTSSPANRASSRSRSRWGATDLLRSLACCGDAAAIQHSSGFGYYVAPLVCGSLVGGKAIRCFLEGGSHFKSLSIQSLKLP